MKTDSNAGPWPGPFIQRDFLGRTYRILAILPDNPTGTAAANAVCAAIPGASVLAVRSGEILVAHKDDVVEYGHGSRKRCVSTLPRHYSFGNRRRSQCG